MAVIRRLNPDIYNSHHMKTQMKIIIVSLLLSAVSAMASSDELKTKAKKILSDNQDAVVWLSVISKQEVKAEGDAAASMRLPDMANSKDEKMESLGTVIDSSGTIVTSLGSISGSGQLDGREIDTPKGKVKLRVKTEFKEIKVILADGTELPAVMVLKDADLDLAFIKVLTDSPEAKGVTFQAVDLSNNGVGTILDDVVLLARMNAELGRQPIVITGEMHGSVKKPREFYFVPTPTRGVPVFLSDGKILGIALTLKSTSPLKAGSNTVQMQSVVLPAKDVLKIASQINPATAPRPAETKAQLGQ